MQTKERLMYLKHVQQRLRAALGFAPRQKDIVLLEASATGDFPDYVFYKIGLQYYSMRFGTQVAFVDENGHHRAFIPSRFDKAKEEVAV